jgi:hypothetical protein
MEAKSNELGYAALKKLDQSGELLFELSCVRKYPLALLPFNYLFPQNAR